MRIAEDTSLVRNDAVKCAKKDMALRFALIERVIIAKRLQQSGHYKDFSYKGMSVASVSTWLY